MSAAGPNRGTPTYPPGAAGDARDEWRPDGAPPASSVSILRGDVLDPFDVERAIVNCYYPVNMGHPDAAAALASAVDDWLIAEWLDADPRLRASMVVPSHEPELTIREIQTAARPPRAGWSRASSGFRPAGAAATCGPGRRRQRLWTAAPPASP